MQIAKYGSDIESVQIAKFDLVYFHKSISSSGPYMLVQFLTDHQWTDWGFSAKIHYSAINPICKDWLWLNVTSGYLTSPGYPTQNCSWVITVSMSSTISIQFNNFEVK